MWDNRVRALVKGRKGHFVDPLLKLYYHAPLMLVSNDDVPNGHANGTRVLLESLVLKADAMMNTMLVDGKACNSVDACDVHHLVCSMENDRSKIFKIKPRNLACSVKAPIPSVFGVSSDKSMHVSVRMTQLPLICNVATTGHKLQGQTKETMVISVWSKKRNWNYVALSRVASRKGLYLVNPLSHTTDFGIPQELTVMLELLLRYSPEKIQWNMDEERAVMIGRQRAAGYARSRN